jgi:TRAP-type C4-dicarboxylate transport system permease small subunit
LSSEKRVQTVFRSMSRYADRIAKIICFPTAFTFLIVLLLQVLFRYVLKRPLEWYLEVVGICYMWSLFMGISMAFKGGSHIQFQFLFNKLGGEIQRCLSLVCQFMALVFFIFMVIYGVKLCTTSKDYILPTIEISQGWKFLCVPISSVILVLHTMDLIVGTIVDIVSQSDRRRDFYRRD